MSDYFLGQGANFALILFALTALVVVGIWLLLYRIADAIKQRRATEQTGKAWRQGQDKPFDSTHEQAPQTMLSGAARDIVKMVTVRSG